ncbi:flagellar hook-basal body protein [Lysinibacillus sphaericus]|uniref:Flagellar basal-body rod protein FlgG n=1 Tax=Lysinibacillus sphaericus TaxID=1421 RepID=A0A2S5D4V1_LYSSH|nr:flagellar hook-basal body protein [Lysinibacillus sphaericus]OEC00828.1 flagellar hook-basal body protein [Lysinibacillus sphaericus]POZ58099.1 Flagellar basal-body rod protein FlgG [Lysinibacillus sphaericus]
MLRTMITATNTMGQLQNKLDTISNNIANSGTHGYKTRQATFNELMYQQFNNDKQDPTVRQSPVGIRYGSGAQLGQIQTNHKQGSLQTTDRDLDLAFTKPKQYFNILMPDGENGTKTVYTRQGDFYLSPLNNGTVMLVNTDGYPVADANGQPITLPDNAKGFVVRNGGMLEATYPNGDVIRTDLAVTEFQKPQLMEHISGTYVGLPDNLAELGYTQAEVVTELQGANRQQIGMQNEALELSNVSLSKEMTDLIETQRAYQFNARAVTLADQMLGLINGVR